jgi:hypothetical protein
VDGVFEEVGLFHWTTFEQPLVADRFQPTAGARFDEVPATNLPIDLWLPMTGAEQADRNWLQPVWAFF